MLDAFLHALVPPRCVGCGLSGSALCSGCVAELAPPQEPARFPFVDRVLCPWDYDGLARRLILDLKLRGLSGAGEPLVEGMVRLALRKGTRAGLVSFVPCRAADRRRRGFDHAQVLARGVARRMGLECRPLLSRVGTTLDQAGLSAVQRAENLRGAFVARATDGHVLLVDDLVTTGATASACARAMRRAGADGVEVLAACRAGMTI